MRVASIVPLARVDWPRSLRNAELGPDCGAWFGAYVLMPDHRSAESYEEKWHYVRENPVRANLVSKWEDWPYRGEPQRLEYRKL